jgi:hypothetical protein
MRYSEYLRILCPCACTSDCQDQIRVSPTRHHSPSEKLLIAIFLGFSAMYSSVASSAPSRIIRWMTMRDLKTIVHVESRSRNWRVRKISAMPASPLCVARRMCSIYFDLGGASCPLALISSSPWEIPENIDQGPGRADFYLGSPLHRLLEILCHCSRSTVQTRGKRYWGGVQGRSTGYDIVKERFLSTPSFRLANWRLRWRLQQWPSWRFTVPCQQEMAVFLSARQLNNAEQCRTMQSG